MQRFLDGRENKFRELLYIQEGFLRIHIQEVEIVDASRVTVVVDAPPDVTVTTIVKKLKGYTGKELMKAYPEIRHAMHEYILANGKSESYVHVWNGSTFIETIGAGDDEQRQAFFDRHGRLQI